MLLAATRKACINKSDIAVSSQDAMAQVWKVLVWSFQYLFYGKFPECDHKGRAWPAGSRRAATAGKELHSQKLRGILFCISADGEYFLNEFKLAGHSSNQCCFNCKANKSNLPHNGCRPSALWKKTIVQRKGTCPTTHPVKEIIGLNGHTSHYDTLHNLELGVTSHAIANCMFDLVFRPGGCRGPGTECCGIVQEVCNSVCGARDCSFPQDQKADHEQPQQPKSKHDNFPDLSGYKARQIRCLLPCLLEIALHRAQGSVPRAF